MTQPIAFDTPGIVPDLKGCSGIARLGLCVRCDRLYQAGEQMHPIAKRGAGGVYSCGKQVVGGVHVTSITTYSRGGQSAKCGGEVVAIHSNAGDPTPTQEQA